jgi:N-acetylglucosamine-6-phosphate deacetylase
MAEWELAHGTTTWYPTTVTLSIDQLARATAQETEFENGANIPGFHLEGPFINKKYKGAQNEDYVIAPTTEILEKCKKVKTISLAPETEGAIEFIKNCPVVVSLGHTDADYDTAMAAFNAGARKLTHTYNCMPGIHHRAPGPIGAGAEHGEVYAELICDGIHIHKAAVKMLIKIYGVDKVILISDSISATGLSDGLYDLGGVPVTVTNGVARTPGGNLAGSTTTLLGCVKKAIEFGISPEDAVKMASENPARLMGLNKGKIAVGYDADFIIVDDDFNLIKAIARGEF